MMSLMLGLTNASTHFAQTSPRPARDIQEDAADLAAVIPWLPGPPLQARRGLTDQDLERITRASEAARAPGTHKIYQYAWAQWATWCAERGFEPLPADPAAMCAVMTQRVADGLAVVSLSPFISVINYVQSAHGLPNPNQNRAVRQVCDGRAPAHLRCRSCSASPPPLGRRDPHSRDRHRQGNTWWRP